jgi:cytochrome c oxidase subunit 4
MSAHAHSSSAESHDHGGFKLYLGVLIALLILTVITVGASYFDFGGANLVIAVFIASVKASLVALFFMHLKDDKPVNGLILVSCFMFLGLLVTFCLLDIDNRSLETPSNKARFVPQGPPSMGVEQTSTDKIPPPNKGNPAGAHDAAADKARAH